jgi:hypothetical protein
VDGDARSGQLEPRPYSNRPNLPRHTLRSSMIDPAYSSERGGQSPGVVPQSKSPGSCDLTRTVGTLSQVPPSRSPAQTGGRWRELHTLKSNAFHGALHRPLLQERNSASDSVNCLVLRWADSKRGYGAHRQLSASRVGDQCVDNLHSLALRFQSL